jgi:hypothetical protein
MCACLCVLGGGGVRWWRCSSRSSSLRTARLPLLSENYASRGWHTVAHATGGAQVCCRCCLPASLRCRRAPGRPLCPQMMGLPTWFKALVYSEIFVQLPFFFLATYAFLGGSPLWLGTAGKWCWVSAWTGGRKPLQLHPLRSGTAGWRRRVLSWSRPAAAANKAHPAPLCVLRPPRSPSRLDPRPSCLLRRLCHRHDGAHPC